MDEAAEPTGVDAVDSVLVDVDGLEERPVAEHVEVFERAHEQLRRALDAAPAPSVPTPGVPTPSAPASDEPGA